MATQEHIEAMKDKALAALARTDGITASRDAVQFITFDGDRRTAGKYLIVRSGDEVAAVYKVVIRLGPDRAVRDEHGIVNYVVDSISFGLKRIKRAPKGLLA